MTSKYMPLRKESLEETEGMESETDGMLEQSVLTAGSKRKSLKSPLLTLVCISVFLIILLGTLTILDENKHEPNNTIPLLPAETVTFQNYTDFSAAPTPENNALWMDLMGPGMGFVAIQNPSSYGLPKGLAVEGNHAGISSDTEVYGISMYHQLHCLIMIREGYWAAMRGERSLEKIEKPGELLSHGMRHVDHCFDYIRQAIMCAGDMTIESAAEIKTERDHPRINGYGAQHECKNYQASREWMDMNVPPT